MSIINFLVFLVDGKYRSLLDRALRMRLVYIHPLTARAVSFEWMNRQLVWHGFTVRTAISSVARNAHASMCAGVSPLHSPSHQRGAHQVVLLSAVLVAAPAGRRGARRVSRLLERPGQHALQGQLWPRVLLLLHQAKLHGGPVLPVPIVRTVDHKDRASGGGTMKTSALRD